jgi:hypothetical protein
LFCQAIPKNSENTCKLILKNKKAIKSQKFIAKNITGALTKKQKLQRFLQNKNLLEKIGKGGPR